MKLLDLVKNIPLTAEEVVIRNDMYDYRCICELSVTTDIDMFSLRKHSTLLIKTRGYRGVILSWGVLHRELSKLYDEYGNIDVRIMNPLGTVATYVSVKGREITYSI